MTLTHRDEDGDGIVTSLTRLHAEDARVGLTTLGTSGARISRVVMGARAWGGVVDAERAREMVSLYREAGGFTLEVSDADGGAAEGLLGDAIAGTAREELFFIGRSGRGALGVPLAAGRLDTSRRALMAGLDATLSRLSTEHLDLWLVDGFDGFTPTHEVAETMEWALTSGRATYVGISDVPTWRAVDLSHELAGRNLRLAAHSIEHNLVSSRPDDGCVEAARARGHGLLGGAALAEGVLSGKYRHGTPADSRRATGALSMDQRHFTPPARAVVESLVTAAEGLGVHPSELALAWQLRQEGLDALMVGARTPAQLRVLLRAGGLVVPDEILAVLGEVSTQR